ncbi:MAG: hypothetical protein Kow00121_13310 [Elainellaceae cyanobacterium]
MLKQLKPESANSDAIARFRHEYDIIRYLDLAGVIRVYSLEFQPHGWVMVEEDFGGESLDRYLCDHKLRLEEFLQLAIQIAEILGNIHQQRVVHRDINPSNILLNSITGQVKLIDFGSATRVASEDSAPSHSSTLEATLAYLSPEQTGRINRTTDYRTDFYSLGVTFYQILCDRLPFEFTDPLELVHAHIAKHPPPVHQLQPQIPQVVSAIVMKLMAKNPQERYQSAWGIKTDLQTCLEQLNEHGKINHFPLAQQDVSEQLQLPQILYGRAQEIETLLAAYDRVCSDLCGRSEVVLVRGQAGTGKSTLVKEVYKSLSQRRGYFIIGKFSLLQRNTPYFPFIQAFQELVQHLLTEGETQITTWRQKLTDALGTNGQVIIDVIPEVELLVGQQPAVASLSAAESRNRFKLVLQAFVRVFAQPQHPLVIFLDDLQWSDQSSLDLMQSMLAALEQQSLLLIGAYRENEVDSDHPAMKLFNQLKKQGAIVNSISLPPLSFTEINQLVADTLHRNTQATAPLAELLAQKTAGNPFFITELLKFLHQEKLIYFDHSLRIWQWQLNQIQLSRLADTVVELVINRLDQLSKPAKQLLTLAACIGDRCDVQNLSLLGEIPKPDVVLLLQEAVQAGLLTADCQSSFYSYNQPAHLVVCYEFWHDRIQQAAYSLISPADRSQIHLQIGRLLLKNTHLDAIETKIFEIVNQLNLGIELITEQNEKDELAQLNLIAGNRAKSAIAYASALTYLNTGRKLLGEQGWTRIYDLTLALYSSLAEAAYLSGDFQQMEQIVEIVLQQAHSLLDQQAAYEVRIQAYIAQNRLAEAIDTALDTLQLLGVKIPKHPAATDIVQEANQTKLALADKAITDLLHLPPMTDPYKLAAMRVIASVCTPTYFTAPQLWQLMVFQKVQLSVNYGNAPGSAFGYGDYGMVLCAIDEDIEAGYQFAQLAAMLLPQLNAKAFVPKTLLLINCYLRHWKEPLRATLAPLRAAYQSGLETGDLEFATFAIAFCGYHSYLAGQELAQLEAEMATYGKTIAQFKQAIPLHLNQLYRQTILNLMGNSQHPCELSGESYNEQEQLPVCATNDRYILFHFHLNKLTLCYLFADYPQAIEHAQAAEQLLLEQATGMLVVPVFYFYSALAQLAIFDQVSEAEQAQILQQIDGYQTKMKHWADHAPMNYLHKYYLVQAERQRVLKDWQAMDDYDRAIALAQEHEYLHEEALAYELTAKFYLARGKFKIAQVYLRDAHRCYLQWGAIAKVKHLETQYPQLLELNTLALRAASGSPSVITSSSTELSSLGMTAVIKAAQVLTREIVLDKLLATLMKLLLESAGAEQGCLILETNGQLVIEAAGTADSNNIRVLQSIPVTSRDATTRIAIGIIHYVARTHENLVIGDASQDSRFAHDPYIIRQQPKSVLCIPLINQSQLTGLVYLENNLTTDAFTSNHLEVIQLLSAQAAISIDNARLYDELDSRVQQRTAEFVETNQRLEREILERQLSEQTLRLIIEGTASVTRTDFFHSLVRSLANALNVRYAFITECDSTCPTHLRAIACWYQNELGKNFEYDVHGTPCEQVISSRGCLCYPSQLQSLFPHDEDFVAMDAQSYAGAALLDSSGQLLGHLAVLDDKPIEDTSQSTAILEIFAARAAAEMERRQAEEAIRISQEKFSKAFRSSPSGITITTIREGRFIEVNDSYLRMLGYTREEMIGKSSLDLDIWVNTDDRETITRLLQAQGTVSNVEVELQRKSGDRFLGLVSAEIIDLEDEPCLLGITTDITVLKQATRALERLAEIGELSSMIVHEVRNPLTTMLMGLNAFKRLELPARFQEYLSLALEEGDRLQRLLNQILLYAKPQTLNQSELELNCLITETLNALQAMPAASARQLQFVSALSSAVVTVDRDKLKQVLINLVTNACEAAHDGAVITVSLQQEAPDRVKIQVHNPGDPIPPDILSKLTKPFFTTKANGNGLGLAIVKRIVEAHAGELCIESSVDIGTTVIVKLPLQS